MSSDNLPSCECSISKCHRIGLTHGYRTCWLTTRSLVVSRTGQLADADSTSCCLPLWVFWNIVSKWMWKQISGPAQKLKPTKAFKVLVIFNIFTTTASGGICKLTSSWIGNSRASESCPVTFVRPLWYFCQNWCVPEPCFLQCSLVVNYYQSASHADILTGECSISKCHWITHGWTNLLIDN